LVRETWRAFDRCRLSGAVATWIEVGTRDLAAPSVKQRLAAIRHLFDWLVTGQVVPGRVASRAASCTKLYRSRGTEGSNPSPSSGEMVWGRRRGDGTIVAASN
jgi:hypothetical protein